MRSTQGNWIESTLLYDNEEEAHEREEHSGAHEQPEQNNVKNAFLDPGCLRHFWDKGHLPVGLEPPILARNRFSNPGLPEISCKEHPCTSETQPSHHHTETVQSHQDVRFGPQFAHLEQKIQVDNFKS